MHKLIILETLKPFIEKEGSLLSRKNIKVLTALSGEEILKIHRAEHVNLIITELKMPDIDGDKLCSLIRNDEVLRKVSLIIICDNDKSDIDRCEACGVNAFITKPVNSEDIFSNIRKFLYVLDRKDLRALYHEDVKCKSGDNIFFAKADNLSSSGILIHSDQVLEKESKISCSFYIEGHPVTVNGKIVRVQKKPPGTYCYGVQFVRVAILTQVRIDKFIENF
ncbi:MAG: response regulator [Nitrospirae bacterium]|nr:response regulator [Nitrospirota bacterium]